MDAYLDRLKISVLNFLNDQHKWLKGERQNLRKHNSLAIRRPIHSKNRFEMYLFLLHSINKSIGTRICWFQTNWPFERTKLRLEGAKFVMNERHFLNKLWHEYFLIPDNLTQDCRVRRQDRSFGKQFALCIVSALISPVLAWLYVKYKIWARFSCERKK